jgi:hypothetical protein
MPRLRTADGTYIECTWLEAFQSSSKLKERKAAAIALKVRIPTRSIFFKNLSTEDSQAKANAAAKKVRDPPHTSVCSEKS